jgi:hypothetical protein
LASVQVARAIGFLSQVEGILLAGSRRENKPHRLLTMSVPRRQRAELLIAIETSPHVVQLPEQCGSVFQL